MRTTRLRRTVEVPCVTVSFTTYRPAFSLLAGLSRTVPGTACAARARRLVPAKSCAVARPADDDAIVTETAVCVAATRVIRAWNAGGGGGGVVVVVVGASPTVKLPVMLEACGSHW